MHNRFKFQYLGRYLWMVALLVLSLPGLNAQAAIAVDNVSTVFDDGNPTSLTVSHLTSAGSDRLMIVGVSFWNRNNDTVTGVTYNGTGLTFIGQARQGNNSRVELWALVNPTATTANVIVNFSQVIQDGAGAGVITFTGVNQTNPYGLFQSNSGNSNTASATAFSQPGETVLGVMAARRQDSGPVVVGGTAQWSYKTQPALNNRTAGAGATFAGAATVNLAWNMNKPDRWAVGAISLREAGVPFLNCDTFRDEFSSVSYSRQDGNANWSIDWNEVGDNGSPNNGQFRVLNNGTLRLRGAGNAPTVLGGPYIEREVDLSGYESATLSFDYRTVGWDAPDDMEIYVSNDGGGSWNLVQTFSGNQGSTFQNFSTDISIYMSSNTRIAFAEKANQGNDRFFFDNVQIAACVTTLPALAHFEMNETSWNGTADEVIDSSGNGNDGTAVGAANTIDPGKICLGGDIPFNNSVGAQDAIDTELDMDSDIGTTGTISLWYKPNTAWAGGGDRMLVDASTTADNKYFFFALLNNGALRFRFEDSTDADFQLDTTAKAFPANEWHHIAVTWDLPGDRLEIYIDGVLDASSTPNTSGSWGALGSVYLGDNRSSYHPSGTPNSANGVIDEARIYNLVQTAVQIQADLNDPGSCLTALAWFQLDAAAGVWNGTPGEVVDQSGNFNNAVALGTGAGVDSVPAQVCRGIDIPFNNTNGLQYGFDSGIDIDNDVGNVGTLSFWYSSNNNWVGGGSRMLADASPNDLPGQDKYFFVTLLNNGRLQFSFEDSSDADFSLQTGVNNISAGVWTHIAITWNMSGNREIYLNGVLAATQSTATNGQIGALRTLYLGDNRSTYHPVGGSANSANGIIDEVRVYDSTLTQSQIQADRDATHSCGATVDHFTITPATTAASTCLPNAITIVAEDAGNNPIPAYTGTVNISTSTNHGNWSVNTASNVTNPNPDNDDNGAVNYTFLLADAGDIILDLTNTRAEHLSVTVAEAVAGVSSTSVVIGYADNVFIITEDPVQVAGRPQAMNIAMWTNDGANCFIDTNYNYAAINLDASIDRGGVLPGANDPDIGVVSIPDGPATNVVTLDFSTIPGQANFNLDTSDVGQYTLTLIDNTNTHGSLVIAGTSAQLTVRPFGIVVTNIMAGATPNPGGTAPADPFFTNAGSNFEATVAGVLWDALDDSNNDGVLDAGLYANNTVAPSYAWDTTLGVSAVAASYTPSPGTPGVLNNATILLAEFGGGSFNVTDLQYTEVGSFTLISSATNFLGETTADIVGDDIVVGRFRPASFAVTINGSGVLGESCSAFTYIGEDFSYSTAPTITVTALNALGATTAQYRDTFAKLDDTSVSADASQDDTTAGSDTNPLLVSYEAAVMPYTVNNDGTVSYTFGADTFRYGPDTPLTTFSKSDNSQVPPFMADINPEISAVSDGEVTTNYAAGTYVLDPTGNNLRFGRLRMDNVFGPELNPLLMPVFTEFWNGTGFQKNILDTCTTITNADLIAVATPPGLSVPVVVNAPASAGDVNLSFPAPGAGNDGFIDTIVDLNSAAHLWLRFDWDADGVFDNDPFAQATFGIFDGNPVQIYIQQIYE